MIAQNTNEKQETSATPGATLPSGDTIPWSTSPCNGNRSLSSLGQAALHYAEHYGWYVFPMEPGTAVPVTPGIEMDATEDPDKIVQWWSRWPRANIGLAYEPSGLVVVHLNITTEQFKDWCVVREECGLDAMTPVVQVQGGHRWLLYIAPKNPTFRTYWFSMSRRGPCAGGSTQATGLALPPSVTYGVTKYAWRPGHTPDVVGPAPFFPINGTILGSFARHERRSPED